MEKNYNNEEISLELLSELLIEEIDENAFSNNDRRS